MTNNKSMEIDLIDLLGFLKKKVLIILAAIVAAVALVFVYNLIFYVPEYQSKATLYILKQNNNEQSVSASDFSTALNVVNDCTYILKMQSVLDEVIDELKLNTDYLKLQKKITTNNPSGTRILEVKAEAATPELAVKIADAVCRIGVERINDSVGFKQVNISEEGKLNTNPSNKPGIKVYALAGMLAAVVVCGIYVVIYLLDDGIHSDDDVQRYLGLSVLGRIPDINSIGKHGKYKYYAYSADDKDDKKQKKKIKFD